MAEGKLEESRPQIEAAIDDMVGYMLFTDEAPLHGPIKGVSTFGKTFPERGPRDRQGRSLRDFDLQKRLFKYPLSFPHDLYQGIRLPAGLGSGAYLSTALQCAHGSRIRIRSLPRLSAGDLPRRDRDSSRHETESTSVLESRVADPTRCREWATPLAIRRELPESFGERRLRGIPVRP